MKKLIFIALIAFLAIGTVTGQARGFGWPIPVAPETVRVEGTLQLQNGQIVLSTGTALYFIPGIMRYIGFIDGLREGARITAEGYASGNLLHTTKLIIGEREYDFAVNAPGAGSFGACCHMGNPMMGHHSYGGPRRGRW